MTLSFDPMAQTYTRLPSELYRFHEPSPVSSPTCIVWNDDLAHELGIQPWNSPTDLANVFSGNRMIGGARPLAQAYLGHQFGHLAMLGDGRAILLGEWLSPAGQRVDIQLKGAGRTPFSRRGDGRAAMGPMLREYLVSEAMNALGIPTTRSLAVVATGDLVVRESMLPGAVLTRVASSHIRVGTFEYAAMVTTASVLRELTEYSIDRHYPDCRQSETMIVSFLNHVIDRQAYLVAQWMLIGFVHGVMNTDNMAISGETIDYGPCAFIDTYHPQTVFSSIDTYGRYSFGNQPAIAAWNVSRFAESLLSLIHPEPAEAMTIAEGCCREFMRQFHTYWIDGMRRKLGLLQAQSDDEPLIDEFLSMLSQTAIDYTGSFHALLRPSVTIPERDRDAWNHWKRQWDSRLQTQPYSRDEVASVMGSVNPIIIPRNAHVEAVLGAALEGNMRPFSNFMASVRHPFSPSNWDSNFAIPLPVDPSYHTVCGT